MAVKSTKHDPLFRYAGGKRWLAEGIAREIAVLAPRVYVEPFLGAGAVALQVEAERYLLGDVNDALLQLWREVVVSPDLLQLHVKQLEQQYPHAEETYNAARELFNARRAQGDRTGLGAFVLYFLAHNYNGLWRENKEGRYNTPYGGSQKTRFKYPTLERLREVSARLRGRTTFFPCDFEETVDAAPRGAVLYADPPYVDTFDQYSRDGFGEADQRRLAAALYRAHQRGVKVFASNTYHPLVHEIYAWATIEDVAEKWIVGGKAKGKRPCVLIRSP